MVPAGQLSPEDRLYCEVATVLREQGRTPVLTEIVSVTSQEGKPYLKVLARNVERSHAGAAGELITFLDLKGNGAERLKPGERHRFALYSVDVVGDKMRLLSADVSVAVEVWTHAAEKLGLSASQTARRIHEWDGMSFGNATGPTDQPPPPPVAKNDLMIPGQEPDAAPARVDRPGPRGGGNDAGTPALNVPDGSTTSTTAAGAPDLAAVPAFPEPERDGLSWAFSDGRPTVSARLLSHDGKRVRLQRDDTGQIFAALRSALSPESQWQGLLGAALLETARQQTVVEVVDFFPVEGLDSWHEIVGLDVTPRHAAEARSMIKIHDRRIAQPPALEPGSLRRMTLFLCPPGKAGQPRTYVTALEEAIRQWSALLVSGGRPVEELVAEIRRLAAEAEANPVRLSPEGYLLQKSTAPRTGQHDGLVIEAGEVEWPGVAPGSPRAPGTHEPWRMRLALRTGSETGGGMAVAG